MTVIAAKMLAPHPVDHFNKTSLQSENELYSGEKTKTKKKKSDKFSSLFVK